jgi:hypothetical protein
LLVTAGSLTYIAFRITGPLLQASSVAGDSSGKPGAAVDGLLTGLAGALDQVGGAAAASGSLNPLQQGAQKLRALQEQIGAQKGFEQITHGLDTALGQGSGRAAGRSGPSRVQGGETKTGETAEPAEEATVADPKLGDPAAVLGKGQLGELARKLGVGDLKLDGLGNLESQLGGLGGVFGGGAQHGDERGVDGDPEPAKAQPASEAKGVKRSVAAGELKHIERPAKPASGTKHGPTRVE